MWLQQVTTAHGFENKIWEMERISAVTTADTRGSARQNLCPPWRWSLCVPLEVVTMGFTVFFLTCIWAPASDSRRPNRFDVSVFTGLKMENSEFFSVLSTVGFPKRVLRSSFLKLSFSGRECFFYFICSNKLLWWLWNRDSRHCLPPQDSTYSDVN